MSKVRIAAKERRERPKATARPDELRAGPAGLKTQFLLETLAALAIGVAFLGLPDTLTVGPNWLALAISAAVLLPLLVTAFVHPLNHELARILRAGLQVLLTAALLSSVVKQVDERHLVERRDAVDGGRRQCRQRASARLADASAARGDVALARARGLCVGAATAGVTAAVMAWPELWAPGCLWRRRRG